MDYVWHFPALLAILGPHDDFLAWSSADACEAAHRADASTFCRAPSGRGG